MSDDNCLSLAGTTTAYIENTLAKETEILKKWFKENSSEANPTKFQSMLISSKGEKETDLLLVIDGIEIDPANNIKVLGITIDQCLKFNKHISDMCSKAGRQLNVLQRLRGALLILIVVWQFTKLLWYLISTTAHWFWCLQVRSL